MSTNLKPMTTAILKSGILSEVVLKEFSKWGFSFDQPTAPITTVEELVLSIEEALQSEGLVIERVTDVDLVRQYMATTEVGTLHVEIGSEKADFPVPYGRTRLGEFILPWKGDNVLEEMTNGLTYLETADKKKHYFNVVREFYYGDTKAFMVCTVWE